MYGGVVGIGAAPRGRTGDGLPCGLTTSGLGSEVLARHSSLGAAGAGGLLLRAFELGDGACLAAITQPRWLRHWWEAIGGYHGGLWDAMGLVSHVVRST